MHACPGHNALWWGAGGAIFLCSMWNDLFPGSIKLENYDKELGIGFKDREIFIYPSYSENHC